MSNVLVIIGSGKCAQESNTLKAVKLLCPFSTYELLDLRTLDLRHYEYDPLLNKEDAFQHVVKKLETAQTIVFATPVYWYAMSGRMKVLFDRFTEQGSKPHLKRPRSTSKWSTAAPLI